MTKLKLLCIILLSVAVLAALVGCNYGGTGATQEAAAAQNTDRADQANTASKDVTAAEALALWQNRQAVIIDVRTPAEYREGHISGVQNIPLDELAQRSNEVPQDKKVLLICRSGRRSAEGTELLRGKGFNNVYNVTQGMLAWTGPVEK